MGWGGGCGRGGFPTLTVVYSRSSKTDSILKAVVSIPVILLDISSPGTGFHNTLTMQQFELRSSCDRLLLCSFSFLNKVQQHLIIDTNYWPKGIPGPVCWPFLQTVVHREESTSIIVITSLFKKLLPWFTGFKWYQVATVLVWGMIAPPRQDMTCKLSPVEIFLAN